ncbi:hypothetical protein MKX01_026548, partial [Papaver californicum]
MQYEHQRRSYLREPVLSQPGPLDGMLISYFTATDSQSDSSMAPTDREVPHNKSSEAIVNTSSASHTFIRHTRTRNLSTVVLSEDDDNQNVAYQQASTSHQQQFSATTLTNHFFNHNIQD